MKTFCGYFNQGICQSCDLMALDYRDQVRTKEALLLHSLAPLFLPEISPSVVSEPFAFRNKAKFVVTGTVENPLIGLLEKEILNCPVHVREINDALPLIKKFITTSKLVPYQIETKKGELKGLILFYSRETKEMYLRFICRSQEPVTRIIKHQQELLKEIPELKVISVNVQPIPHAILEGEEEIFITSESSLHHRLGPVEMRLGPRAFVQTNQDVAKNLYQTAALWIKENKTKRFLELFCGQGAFSFFAASSIEAGLGIEINPDAIKEANATATRQGLHHLKFISRDAGKVQNEIDSFGPDLLLVNPPRRGLSQTVDLLMKAKPQTIIYSSCSHESLGSDLKKLDPLYSIRRIQLFDMFPQTNHFETLVELVRR